MAEDNARSVANRALRKKTGRGRLPDGSRFDVTWNEGRGSWTGSLDTTIAGARVTITADAKNVFGLLSKLDHRYRATLPENAHLVVDKSTPAASPTVESTL